MSTTRTPAPPAAGRPRTAAPPPRKPAPTFRLRLSRFDVKASPYFYISPFFILFALVGMFPLMYTMWVSLHEWDLLKGQGEFVGLGNFVEILGDRMFWNSLGNTVSIFLLSTIPQIIVALGVAYLLDQGLRAPTFWRMGVLVPFVVTPVAVALIFSSVFNEADGLANNLLNLIGVADLEWKHDKFLSHLAIATMVNFRWTGYNALILLAAMQAVPRELYESAAIDGANSLRRFLSITIPTIRPTFVFVIITSTIGGLQIFSEPKLFDASNAGGIGGSDRQFQTTVLFLWEMAFFRRNFGEAAAVAWLLFLIIIAFGIFNFLLSRRIATGDAPKASRRERRLARKGSGS
ncbi:sugar ABC transporter permease [Microbacterium faecale]|uniref:Sugar ABC transporter permease n=1 Tax=Microbacterium faecale TaxID=1804630 RepID=A0A916Y000_9MICO|nr:sugar ABC transporter permease [Microbacterium faecale]GGD24932.1 sugar ABC transporter permease [Microbacterium faecale]